MKKLKAHRLKDEITKLQLELKLHQDKCNHAKSTKEYGSNTGNYCPQDDCYWTTFSCPTCLKVWTVDGSV